MILEDLWDQREVHFSYNLVRAGVVYANGVES